MVRRRKKFGERIEPPHLARRGPQAGLLNF